MDDAVAKALHAVRHHLAGGGFLSDLFSGPDYLSTGEVASPTNWGDPEVASDFFKADRALRLAREVQAKSDDVTGSVPVRAPLTAPRPGAVEVRDLPVNIPFAAPDRGVSLLSSDISPASVTSLPLAYAPAPTQAPAANAIDQATGKMTARMPEEPHGTALTKQQADYVIRTIAAETSGKSPEETQAIASVILNRINSGKYGNSPEAVLFAKRQFEPWMNPAGKNYPMKISPESQRYLDAREALEAAMAGEDITRGATNFWGPKSQYSLGRDTPDWAVKMPDYTDIGATRFHRPNREEGGEVEGYAGGGDVIAKALAALRGGNKVFPKPQRMFPEGARPPGGEYINAATGEAVTGQKPARAVLGVTPEGKPVFLTDPEQVDVTGSPGKGSTKTMTNLFRRSAGWDWRDAPEGYENVPMIVSTENRNKHYYSLGADYPKGVDLARYPKETSEPRLKPTTQGNVYPGEQVGTIVNKKTGDEHPVYDMVTIRNMLAGTGAGAAGAAVMPDGEERYAHGGEIHGEGTMSHDDIVSRALHAARRHFNGLDGSYVDPMGNVAFPAAGPEREQAPIATDNAERMRAAEEKARLARDIQAFEASNARIDAQPQWAREMTHRPSEPRANIAIDAFGRERVLGNAPYPVANPLSSLAQFGYGLKTAPLYAAGAAFPPAAMLGTAIDTAEGIAAGSPTQVAMGAFGMPASAARNVFGPLAVASGLTAPDEAEAARAPKIGNALSGAARGELSRVAPKVVDPSLEKAFDIVRAATTDDAGQAIKAAKQVSGTPQRGILATPDLRQVDRDEAIRLARSEPHLIQDASGQYVGAPRGITTPEQIKVMREAFDRDVEAGAVGGDWYERAREFNREVSGNDPYRQKLIANEEALWSAQANPDTNLGFGLNARTDYEAGKYGDKYRTGQQARSYGEARRAMEIAKTIEAEKGMMGHNRGPALTDLDVEPSGLSPLGKKTGIYGQHLDPTVPPATTGTNDIWHARGFGYTNQDGGLFSRALTPQEHRFLDYETMLAVDRANARNLAGRSDWTGAEIQAAPWVAGKGRALAERGNKPLEQGIAEASQTYPDVAPKYTYSTPIEQIPGANTGLLPNLINADDATKAAFTARANWKDPEGRDLLWSELGMPTRYTNDTLGAYRNSAGNVEFNPLEIGRPMSGFAQNEAGNPVANPRMAAGLSMGQAARGLIDFQEGTPWNKFITHGAGPDKTSIHIGIGRNPTKEELDALMQLGQKHGLDLTNTEGGVGFINFKDNQTTASVGKDLKNGLLKEIKSILPDATVQRARFQGDYFDLAESGVNQLAKENQGKGLATKKLFDTLSELRDAAPDFYNRILDSEVIAGKARSNLERLIEYGGKGDRKDGERLLKIVGEDKLRGLLDRVNKLGYEGLPAIGAVGTAGAVLGSSASKDGSEPGRYD